MPYITMQIQRNGSLVRLKSGGVSHSGDRCGDLQHEQHDRFCRSWVVVIFLVVTSPLTVKRLDLVIQAPE